MSHYGTGALGSRLSVLAVVARRPVEDTAGISHRWDPDPSYDAAMGELWPGTAARPFVDNACGGPYLRMGPAGPAVRTAPLRAALQYFLHRACTWDRGLWASQVARARALDRRADCRASLRSVPEVRGSARQGRPHRDVQTGMSRLGCPDWDVELPSSSTGGAGPGARVPGVSFSGSKVYLGL